MAKTKRPMQGAGVQSLVRELNPTCRNSRVGMPQIKIPHVQLRPGEAKYINNLNNFK